MNRSILYIGSLEETCNTFRRFKALERMGHKMMGIDTRPFIYESLYAKFHHHINIGPGIFSLNKEMIKAIEKNVPDLLWVDNKPFLQAWSLKKIRSQWPHIKIINVITDDPTGKYRYAWRLCLKTTKYYDIHFVQRSINIAELKKYGARRVEICYRSYDPVYHHPVILNEFETEMYSTKVGFVGSYETYREEHIVHLIKNNIPVKITGDNWEDAKHWKIIQPYYKGPAVYGDAYIKTISGFDIALHFLRHVNRDEQDSRTFEIPAVATFMLAERSDLHLSLFAEGKEAVFFETKDELLLKVQYYLEHTKDRDAIAKAGHQRCLSSGYSHEARLKKVIQTVFE